MKKGIKDIKIGKYKHHKGTTYDVLALGVHTENRELLVIYADFEKRIWVRPHKMFIENVVVDGKEQKRFEYMDSKKEL